MDGRYLSARAAAAHLSISRTMFDRLVKAGSLPQPIRLSKRLLRWDRVEIDAIVARASNSKEGMWDARIKRNAR